MIHYVLRENLLANGKPDNFWARITNQRSCTEDDLAEAIVRSNSGVSKPEAIALLELIAEIQLEWISEGRSFNTRLAHFRPSVPGNFQEGEYPKEAIIKITPSKAVAEAAKNIRLRRVEPALPIDIYYIRDMQTGMSDSRITSGGTLKIAGHNLRITGDNPAVGAEFVSTGKQGTTYRVPAKDIILNNPSELMLIVPEMPAGEPVLFRVTTQFSNSVRPLKRPRSIPFGKELTVV